MALLLFPLVTFVKDEKEVCAIKYLTIAFSIVFNAVSIVAFL